MFNINAKVFGDIILKTLSIYPELFVDNNTLGDVFATALNDASILSVLTNATGFTKNQIETTIDLYLEVDKLTELKEELAATKNTNSTPSYICSPALSPGYFTVMSLIPAVLIIILLSLLSQRKRNVQLFGRTISRPGLVIPVNLVDSYENRFAFACAFGATTTKWLHILLGQGYYDIFPPEFNAWLESPEVPSYSGTAWRILAMFTMGFAYYPLFACMATDYKVTGYVIGMAYSALWLVFTFAKFYQCPSLKSEVFRGDNLLMELPVFLCLSFLFVKYLRLLIMALYTRYGPSASPKDEENEWMTFYKYRYVVKLLDPIQNEQIEEASFRGRLEGKVYKWKPEFKYSTRVVCTYFISFVGIYVILISYIKLGVTWVRLRKNWATSPFLVALSKLIDIDQFLLIQSVAIFVAVVLSAIYAVVLVAGMLSLYREHLLRLQRGDKQFLPLALFSKAPPSITVATLKYSGFQVAYLCLGLSTCVLCLSVIGFLVGWQLIIPMAGGGFDSFLWMAIRNYWPAFAISMVFYFIQLLLSKYVFLIDKDSMALDNRRFFHVCTFFLFFFNIFLGLFSCLQRIIIGAVTGVMFLGRTQQSLLSRNLELKDPGFNAYVGYLLLEHTHANPVLVTFCHLLIKTINEKQVHHQEGSNDLINHADADEESTFAMNTVRRTRTAFKHRRSRKNRNRWHLYLTLHNNPSLKEHRRSEMFAERSAIAAFGIMMHKGVAVLNNAVTDREGGRNANVANL
ncbi:stimulated by retinoic acid gene 6 protein-like [Montipora foliosa]|uniref:stimulated by retinoic acid gene 6 protein-like n=1 Tax=Montipora foliosa TaxID=591990 RepID=UPI0035F17E6D